MMTTTATLGMATLIMMMNGMAMTGLKMDMSMDRGSPQSTKSLRLSSLYRRLFLKLKQHHQYLSHQTLDHPLVPGRLPQNQDRSIFTTTR